MIFDKFMRVYPQKTTKKIIKNSVFVAIPSMKFPFNSCPQKSPFLEHLNANISGTACPNLKSKPILKSSQQGL